MLRASCASPTPLTAPSPHLCYQRQCQRGCFLRLADALIVTSQAPNEVITLIVMLLQFTDVTRIHLARIPSALCTERDCSPNLVNECLCHICLCHVCLYHVCLCHVMPVLLPARFFVVCVDSCTFVCTIFVDTAVRACSLVCLLAAMVPPQRVRHRRGRFETS